MTSSWVQDPPPSLHTHLGPGSTTPPSTPTRIQDPPSLHTHHPPAKGWYPGVKQSLHLNEMPPLLAKRRHRASPPSGPAPVCVWGGSPLNFQLMHVSHIGESYRSCLMRSCTVVHGESYRSCLMRSCTVVHGESYRSCLVRSCTVAHGESYRS